MAAASPEEAVRTAERAVSARGTSPDQLIAVLQYIQKELGYLPKPALREVARLMNLPIMQVYQVATFFKAFSLEPRGRHIVSVCMGTACHVRQSPLVLQALERSLGIKAGQTTSDGEFTLLEVGCLGACALGPVVDVNGRVYGHMTVRKAEKLPDQIRKEERRAQRQTQVS